MSSSKSVAAARNRRTEAPPPQYKNGKPSGPITSINTAGGPGLNSRAQPPLPQYQQQQPQYQQQQQQPQYQHQEQAIPSKVTVANAISLLTVRIARLEQFVHRYNLEQSGSQPKQGSQGNATDNVEARLDDSILRNIVTRLDNLEKDKKTASAATAASANVNAPVRTQVITQVAAQPVAEDPTVIKLNNDLAQLKQEVKDTEALLLKLQSFTMETNQKLVNMLFQDTNEITMTQLTNADCNYEYDPTCENDDGPEGDDDNENTSAIEVLDDIGAVDMQTASGNLKDLINEELARMPL